MRIRELENQLLDRKYDIEKKRKKDEESEQRWATLWKIAEKYGLPLGAMLLPPIIEGIRKLNAGPNYVPSEVNFEKVQEIIKNAQAAAEGGEVNIPGPHPPPAQAPAGTPPGEPQQGQPSAGQAQGAPPPPAGAPEMHPLEAFHRQIALDLVRFMGLVRMKGHVDVLRGALEDPEIAAMYDEIVQATVTADASMEGINKLATLALQLGGVLAQRQDVAMKVFMAVDGFEQEAMKGLMELMRQYAGFVQHLSRQQQQGQGGGAPPNGAP